MLVSGGMKPNWNHPEGGPRKNTFSAKRREGRVRSALKNNIPDHSMEEDKDYEGIGQKKA